MNYCTNAKLHKRLCALILLCKFPLGLHRVWLLVHFLATTQAWRALDALWVSSPYCRPSKRLVQRMFTFPVRPLLQITHIPHLDRCALVLHVPDWVYVLLLLRMFQYYIYLIIVLTVILVLGLGLGLGFGIILYFVIATWSNSHCNDKEYVIDSVTCHKGHNLSTHVPAMHAFKLSYVRRVPFTFYAPI